jgi:uncharacterized protein with von Willebrand factor type A (vWA) domain
MTMDMPADIMERLGLAGDDSPAEELEVTDTARSTEPESDTVLKLDTFGKQRGAMVMEESKKVREAFKKASLKDLRAEQTAADLFGVCFEPNPKFHVNPGDKLRAEFVQSLMHTNDIHELRQSTAGSVLGSTIAASQLATRYSEYFIEAGGKAECDKADGKYRGRKGEHKPSELETALAAMKAAGSAAKAAKAAVDEASDCAEGFGLGGNGPEGGKGDMARVSSVLKRVKKSRILREVCEAAGRWRRIAAGKQRQKVSHGYDDMVGTELSGDPGRIIPSELVALAEPLLAADAERRLVEKVMLSREYHGIEKVGKGPIVVVVDESGSMEGEKNINAKAFALTMAWVAKRQKRWCCLVGFSGGAKCNTLVLSPKSWDEAAMMDWVEHFFSGGSHRDVPLEELPLEWPGMIAKGLIPGKTDVIFFTDAICNFDAKLKAEFNEFKKREKVKVTTVGVGVDDVGTLETVSDRMVCVPNILPSQGEVADILSV